MTAPADANRSIAIAHKILSKTFPCDADEHDGEHCQECVDLVAAYEAGFADGVVHAAMTLVGGDLS